MQRDWPDMLAGLALVVVGLGAAVWAGLHYEMGTLRRMGPGFFPVTLGVVLMLFGLGIAWPAMRRHTDAIRPDGWAMLAVLAAIIAFGAAMSRLGLVGATFVAVLIATLPAPRPGWAWRIVLGLAAVVLIVLVFHAGLRMNVNLWPRLS
ncbi:MAG: tripartite tricarboxylate transporter TctB family protein [Roseovarius sp.]|nr:tripartite tricarboxylate transporter TctB family protein [Roseovarius sp.]